MKNYLITILIVGILFSCSEKKEQKTAKTIKTEIPFIWESANLYFLLTDRFNNGDTSYDINFEHTKETAKLRGFKGGDIKGITQKLRKAILQIWV